MSRMYGFYVRINKNYFGRQFLLFLQQVHLKFVGTLKDRYIRKIPLPGAPRIQHARHTSHGRFSLLSQSLAPNCHKRMEILAPWIQHASHASHVTHDTCYSEQVPRISTWSDLTRSLAGLGRSALLPFSLALM
jgi:hypothetical protein